MAAFTSLRVGMIIPSANIVAEEEMRLMLPAQISLHTTRLKLTGSSVADLLAMQEDVGAAASLLADAQVDLIAFHCTAVSTFSSELEESIVTRARDAACTAVVTAGQALVDRLRRIHASRIVLVTPYMAEITRRESTFLADRGFSVLSESSANIELARDMPRLPAAHWKQRVLEARHPHADAYVLSCNGIRSHEVLPELCSLLGKPVITSNSALASYCTDVLARRQSAEFEQR